LFAFGTLDANAAGIALMIFAVALFVAEIKIASHGILTAGGIAALLIGTIIVFPPLRPTFPGVRASVDPAVIAVVVGLTGAFFFGIARLALRSRTVFVPTGSALLLGATGVARSDIDASGIAYVGGEDWTAVSEAGPIAKGSPVRVRRVDSLRLIVEPAKELPERRGAS
jgi:membrane-bound serine protease (ClpP class)